jgi:hypothetical protein
MKAHRVVISIILLCGWSVVAESFNVPDPRNPKKSISIPPPPTSLPKPPAKIPLPPGIPTSSADLPNASKATKDIQLALNHLQAPPNLKLTSDWADEGLLRQV